MFSSLIALYVKEINCIKLRNSNSKCHLIIDYEMVELPPPPPLSNKLNKIHKAKLNIEAKFEEGNKQTKK